MGTMLILLGVGLLFGLGVFFVAEEKSLKNADFSDMRGLFTRERSIIECAGEFDTIRYMLFYVVLMFFLDFVIADYIFIPNAYGLQEVLIYTFIPALVGSWFILIVKWTYQPIIKLVSSFFYGAGYIAAAGLSFALVYAISA